GLEHGIGLADSRRCAEKNPQPPTALARLLGPDLLEQLVRIRPGFGHLGPFSASSARFSSRTLTRGSPRTPANLPSVCSAINVRTRTRSRPRTRATRAAW